MEAFQTVRMAWCIPQDGFRKTRRSFNGHYPYGVDCLKQLCLKAYHEAIKHDKIQAAMHWNGPCMPSVLGHISYPVALAVCSPDGIVYALGGTYDPRGATKHDAIWVLGTIAYGIFSTNVSKEGSDEHADWLFDMLQSEPLENSSAASCFLNPSWATTITSAVKGCAASRSAIWDWHNERDMTPLANPVTRFDKYC